MSPASRRLEERVTGIRRVLQIRASIAAALWAGVGIVLLLLVAWLLAGADGWRPGSDVPFALDALVMAVAIGAFFGFRRGLARWFGEARLTGAIERAAGLGPGLVRGSLELARSRPSGASAALVGRAAETVTKGLDGFPTEALTGSLGDSVTLWLRRGSGVLAAMSLVVIALAVGAPERSARAWASLASPLRTMAAPVLPPILVMPGTVEVLRGTDVQITIQADGRVEVELAWQAAGDVARAEVLDVEEGRAAYVFRSVTAPIEYRVRGEGSGETVTYRIQPIDPLFVSDLVLGVVYPAHTGLPPDEYRGDPPPLLLPVGARLTIEGRASRPLAEAALTDTTGTSVLSMTVQGTGFRADWTPTRSGIFDWGFLDDDGAPAEIQPEPLRLELVADSAPLVAIPLPGVDTILPMNLRQPLILEARDDYGLDRLELVAYRVTAFGERHQPVVQGIDLGGTRAALARPLLDLGTWGLMPGDTVRYFARAVDNAPTGQVSSSREFILRMPASAELQRQAETELEAVAERLQELADEAARQAEENQDQARANDAKDAAAAGQSAQEQEQAGFEEREELQQALEEQQALTGEVDSLRAEMEELQRMMEDAAQSDPEFRERMKELQELLKELSGSELAERMKDLEDALEQGDMDEANKSLSELAEQQEDFKKKLEESLERFRRAALEQDLRATKNEAEELARQEQALADAMKEEDAPELRAQQQKDLSEQADQLQRNMERLQERLKEMDEPDAARKVQDAREQASEAQQKMQQAQQRSEQGENQEAGEKADEAAKQMQDAAEELSEAQEAMAQQQMEAQQEALRQTADDALSLARRQNELRERMRGASQEQVAQMRADEASLLQGVQNLAQNLQDASDGATEGSREVSAAMGRAMESMQKTIESMESRRGSAPSPFAQAEQAIGDLNQLALMAMAGAEQMGQPGEGESGEETAEQLEQLAQQQGELMNQAAELQPMQLGEQAMAEQMQQMSQGQESIAEELGDLADEPGAEEALGDLDELAKEAAAIAQQMAQGRLTPEIAERQERLFHRLLDAGRSLEREEFSDERESERVSAFERGAVAPLTPEQMGALRFQLPGGEQLQRLSPAVRQLVIQYFERLNRDRTPVRRGGS